MLTNWVNRSNELASYVDMWHLYLNMMATITLITSSQRSSLRNSSSVLFLVCHVQVLLWTDWVNKKFFVRNLFWVNTVSAVFVFSRKGFKISSNFKHKNISHFKKLIYRRSLYRHIVLCNDTNTCHEMYYQRIKKQCKLHFF